MHFLWWIKEAASLPHKLSAIDLWKRMSKNKTNQRGELVSISVGMLVSAPHFGVLN
jgi:hypothetical protein